MAKKSHPPPLIFLFAILLQCCQSQSLESKGFTLELHRREIQPLDQYFPSTIRPTITRSTYLFTIDATIGTPAQKRTFIFDTGSGLTWTQCKPCINCFKQNYPLFDPKQSTSYQTLPPNHPLAQFFRRSSAGQLTFNVTYESGQSASGTAGAETLTFPSNKAGRRESVKGVVFGCMNNYKGQFTANGLVTGIMGMNRSPLSLVGQLGTKSARRFSYCLPMQNSGVKSTFLRFGSDVTLRGSFKKTSFLTDGNEDYSVRMLGVSVSGRRLNLPKGAFSMRCVLDVGSAASTLEMGVYTPLLATLTQHFDRFNLTRVRSNSSEGDLCYRMKPGFRNFPSMTMHFQGADLEVGPENLFRGIGDKFCLALFGTPHLTLLGAYQQQNVRLVYDVGNQKFLFAKEDCSRDRA